MASEIRNEEGEVQEVDDGGPAFPQESCAWDFRLKKWVAIPPREGISKRDYFAAHALTGILAAITERWHANEWLAAAKKHNMEPAQLVAESAYERADAMLEARKEKP